MTIHIHQDDLPSNLDFGNVVAIDTETMGLNPLRDRLCLVQLSSGDGEAHLVKINSPMKQCPNLRSEERRVGKECRSRWSPYH